MTALNKFTLCLFAPLVLFFCLHAVSEDMVKRQAYAIKHGEVVLWKEIDPCSGELICQLTGGKA